MIRRLTAACGGFGLVLLLAVSAAGAAGGAAERAPSRLANAPVAKETIKQFAARFEAAADAAAAGKCKTLNAFNALNLVRFPCGGAAGRSYADFEVTGTATFGTGGVVDFTDREAPDGATALVALDQSGKYGVMISLLSGKREVGTKPRQAAVSDRAVKAFIRAVREEDCDAYFEHALTFTQNKAKECKAEFASSTPDELAADPGAKPVRFGGVADFVFYGLSTAPDGYRTLVTLPGPHPPPVVVLSYSARPTS